MGRRGKALRDTRRRPARLEERERALIVIEGSKTEPLYFERLIQELGLTAARVKIAGEGGSAPISVVEYAKRFLRNGPDFEYVFLVFDRDRHATYRDAINQAGTLRPIGAPGNQSIETIPSVPSFEIWYRFHVTGGRKPYPAGEGVGSPARDLINDLKADHPCFATYDRASCDAFYDTIKPMRERACIRADRALEEARREGQELFQENPSTRVHSIVRRLQDMARKQDEDALAMASLTR